MVNSDSLTEEPGGQGPELDERAPLLKLWPDYSQAYTVFRPEGQTDPHDRDRE